MDDSVRSTAAVAPNPYETLGVRTFINCCGARTVHGGSLMPAEVIAAMNEAARAFVHIPELMERAGERIASLLGAEAATVSAGGASSLTLATAAALTRGDPEVMLRLPATDGHPHTVLTPAGGRFAYDQAIRAAGANIVEVSDLEAMTARLKTGTAVMIALLGGRAETPPLRLADCVAVASRFDVPVLVDAASEAPSRPDRYIAEGASMVAYSGGKYVRGPQSTGLLLGSKRWIDAAWRNASPHHAVARGMKVSKEEICGIVAAVELLIERDPAEETRIFDRFLAEIAREIARVDGVETRVVRGAGRVESMPTLRIDWSGSGIVLPGLDLRRRMLVGEPAIMLDDRSADGCSIAILPFNLQPAEPEIVGRRIAEELVAARGEELRIPSPPEADITGEWDVALEFLGNAARHKFHLVQNGSELSGSHETSGSTAEMAGTADGDAIELVSFVRLEGTNLAFRFDGRVAAGVITGSVELGTQGQSAPGPLNQREFGRTGWRAVRRPPETAISTTSPTIQGESQ